MNVEELSLIAVAVLIVVVGVAIVAGRIGIATPLILVVLGIGVGYLPGVPLIRVDPEIVLVAVLPPLLYSAAVNVPVLDLRRNIGPIAGLSVVLVIVSALVIGALLHLVFPALPLGAGVALGAVVAPTDAVAATSIGKRLGLPARLVTILEGESLVNDATSLVLLRTAIAAVAGSFVFWEAVGTFAYAVVVAVIIGLIVGAVTVWVRSRLNNPVYDTVLSFAVPFIAFAPTEYLHASGVLAVVVTGLYSGHHAARKFSATARVNERLNWRTAQFLVENGVFLLMGLELHALVDDVGRSDVTIGAAAVAALGVVVTLIVLRLAFMAPMIWALRRSLPRYEARASTMQRLAERAESVSARSTEAPEARTRARARRIRLLADRSAADLQHAREQGLDRRGGLIIGWSGMRGVVTLAAAQSIPVTIPYRSQLVVIAFLVAVVTLLLHGLTLPPLIRRLRPRTPSGSARTQELVSLYHDLVDEGSAALEGVLEREHERAAHEATAHEASERTVRRARASVRNSLAPLAFAMPPSASPERATAAERESNDYLRLARVALDAQRAALLEERAIGRYSSAALRAAEDALDAHEMRLTPPQRH